jgi:hypothetical protein
MDTVAIQSEFAAGFRLTYDEYKKLVTAMTADEVITCLELLRCVKHRSQYRADRETRIRKWLADPKPSFSKPLNPHEFDSLRPKWPIKYQLPH